MIDDVIWELFAAESCISALHGELALIRADAVPGDGPGHRPLHFRGERIKRSLLYFEEGVHNSALRLLSSRDASFFNSLASR